MNKTIKDICDALDLLSTAVLNASTDDRLLLEIRGWNHAPFSRHDLANMAKKISTKLRNSKLEKIDVDLEEQLSSIPQKLNLLRTNTIAYIFNGNGAVAIPIYTDTLQWIERQINQLFDWDYIEDTKAMPAYLARRIRSLNTQVDNILINKVELEKQIKLINDATSAAENLPTDLESLKEARKKIETNLTDAITERAKIKELLEASQTSLNKITNNESDTAKLVDKCEEAYRITTTKGLAGAFEQRANKLSFSMWTWVLGLLLALSVGAIIGAERLQLLTNALTSTDPHAGVITLQIILSMLSVGAPLWFAWLATKQIGQRFRLAEDYAYKATVAKAYEGYKKEASRIDEALEARLFSTALTRVEEAPLRLVDNEDHGSPWHEFIRSDIFQNTLKTVPEFRDKFIEVAKDGLKTSVNTVTSVTKKSVDKD